MLYCLILIYANKAITTLAIVTKTIEESIPVFGKLLLSYTLLFVLVGVGVGVGVGVETDVVVVLGVVVLVVVLGVCRKPCVGVACRGNLLELCPCAVIRAPVYNVLFGICCCAPAQGN